MRCNYVDDGDCDIDCDDCIRRRTRRRRQIACRPQSKLKSQVVFGRHRDSERDDDKENGDRNDGQDEGIDHGDDLDENEYDYEHDH